MALLLVPGGHAWATLVWVRWLADLAMAVGVAGMILAGWRLGRGLTASPLPNQAAWLRTGGLYAYVRHPIYTALLTFAAGRTIPSGSLARLGLFLALVALLSGKSRWEEKHLAARFPDYAQYAARTPCFLPNRLRMRRSDRT